jgi:hypothetical protein
MVMAMIGPISSLGAAMRLKGTSPLVQMALDVFHHDDGVIHDETDGENDGEKREEIQREAEREHEERLRRPARSDRNHRDDDRPPRAEEKEDHHDDDRQRLDHRAEHFFSAS